MREGRWIPSRGWRGWGFFVRLVISFYATWVIVTQVLAESLSTLRGGSTFFQSLLTASCVLEEQLSRGPHSNLISVSISTYVVSSPSNPNTSLLVPSSAFTSPAHPNQPSPTRPIAIGVSSSSTGTLGNTLLSVVDASPGL